MRSIHSAPLVMAVAVYAWAGGLAAQERTPAVIVSEVRAWRLANEPAIVRELTDLLAIRRAPAGRPPGV